MADAVFHFGRQFSKSSVESLRDKNRIITESTFSSRPWRKRAGHDSFERMKNLAATRQREHATKARWRLCSHPDLLEIGKQFGDIFFIAGSLAGISRGKNSRRALEHIDLQTGIIRYDKIDNFSRDVDRFRNCILFKRLASFFGRFDLRKRIQIDNFEIVAEQLREFTRLMHIARRDNQPGHMRKFFDFPLFLLS